MKSLKIIKAVLLVIIIGCAIYVVDNVTEYKVAENEYRELQEFMIVTEASEEETDKNNKTEPASSTKVNSAYKEKLEQLKSENSGIIGWFSITGTNISYPLMQAIDNEYYLKHTFKNKVNSSGSIFLDSANDRYFSDCHSIIYGHNMKNRTMFGNIREYMKEEYFNSHKEITIYREDCVDIYEVFSAYVSAIDDKGYSILNKEFLGTEENESFVNELQTKSKFKTKTKLSGESKVITLSTCTGDTSTRYIVHAVLIDSIKYGNEK